MTREEAVQLLEACLKVMFARDKKAHDEIMIGTVTQEGVKLDAPYRLDVSWDHQSYHARTNEFYRPMSISY